MQNAKKVMLALLRSSVCGEEVKSDIKALCDRETLSEVYELSQSHSISQIIADAIYKNGIETSDERFKNASLFAVRSVVLLEAESDAIYAIFEKAEISFLPLKGALVRSFYREPHLRTSCDIDVLVKKEDCGRAEEALCKELGYTKLPAKTVYDYKFISPSGVVLELHYTLSEGDFLPGANAVLDSVWDMCEKGESQRHYMPPCLFLFYYIAHMARHFIYGGCGVRSFADLWLIQKNLAYSEEEVLSLLEKGGLSAFYNAAMSLCKVWFSDGDRGELLSAFEDFVLEGGVFGTLRNNSAMRIQRKGGKLRSLMSVIFLPRENLESMYPELRERKGLFAYYQVKRWFRIFNKEKREKVRKIGASIGSVSEESGKEAERLLDFLGLK